MRKDGIVRIERRWVENSLPDHELLDAVAIAYGRLCNLVEAAHLQLAAAASVGATQPNKDPEPDGRPPCMIGHAQARTLDVWLATGIPIEFESIPVKIDLAKAPASTVRQNFPLAIVSS